MVACIYYSETKDTCIPYENQWQKKKHFMENLE